MGHLGRALVVCLAMTEFFGASCMAIIVIWRTLAELLPTGALLRGVSQKTACSPACAHLHKHDTRR